MKNELRYIIKRLQAIVDTITPSGRRPEGYLSMREAAEAIGIKTDLLRHDITLKRVGGPSHQWTGPKKWYHTDDLPTLKEYYRTRPDFRSHAQELRRAAGLVSLRDISVRSGLAPVSISYWINSRAFAKPTHKAEGCPGRFYTEAEAKVILKFLDDRKNNFHRQNHKKAK